ncbi:MAG TPA: dihydropteroate synthase [Ignavibacteria bacterium]|nr:dihydropteroate synthase [Ignavibacteria bacterium]
MAILNVTPDSFSDGGKYYDGKLKLDKILNDAVQCEKDGADFIDIGGESTRPGSESISIDEELSRVIPVIEILKNKIKIPISIDTYKSEVAEEALKTGAEIVNDISGFKFDEKISKITAKYNATCILMHIKGTPRDMQKNPEYKNVLTEVYDYLSDSIDIAKKEGIQQIITDPGIGFGKTLEQNLTLIKNISLFRKLNCPVLLGASNKSFIDKITPTEVSERLSGTISANVSGIFKGANILRVHNVKENFRAMKIADEIKFNTI